MRIFLIALTAAALVACGGGGGGGSGGSGSTNSASTSIPTTPVPAPVPTVISQITYDAEGSLYVSPQVSNVYFAVPIKPSTAFTVHYVGLSIGNTAFVQGVYSDWTSLAIYSDNAGVPGSVLSTTNSFLNYFTTSLKRLDGTAFTNFSNPQAKLIDPGLPLSANTLYWIVVQYPSSTAPSYDKATFSTVGLLRKMSNDGVNWVNWNECCNQNGLNYSANYLPGHFLAN